MISLHYFPWPAASPASGNHTADQHTTSAASEKDFGCFPTCILPQHFIYGPDYNSFIDTCIDDSSAGQRSTGNFKCEDISTLTSCSPALEVLPQTKRPTKMKTVRNVARFAMTALNSSSHTLEVLTKTERPTSMKTIHIVARLETTSLSTSETFLLEYYIFFKASTRDV